MSDAPIPLFDGEPCGARIIHERAGGAAGSSAPESETAAATVRGRRKAVRRRCRGILVCFSPTDSSGRTEHVICPLIDLSRGGFCVEFDRPLAIGVRGAIAYRTVSHRPVNVSATVRHCAPLGGNRYRIGLKLARFLDGEELKPAHIRPGNDVAPGLRPRKLRPTNRAREEATPE
ncbi:MAG: PilZ domain-containing protein [Phycisphaerae bacterium]